MKQELIDKVEGMIASTKEWRCLHLECPSEVLAHAKKGLAKAIVASLKLDEGKVVEVLHKAGFYKFVVEDKIAKTICDHAADVITVEDMFDGYGN